MLLFLICFIRERMLFWVVMVNKWMFYLQNRLFSRPQNDPKLAPEMAPKVPPKWPWIGSWNGSWSERKPLPILKKSLPKRLPNRLPIPIFRDRESESGVTFFSLPILKKSLPKRLPKRLPNPLPIPIFRDRESESGVTFFLTPDSHSRSRSRFFGWKSLPICQKNREWPKNEISHTAICAALLKFPLWQTNSFDLLSYPAISGDLHWYECARVLH